MRLTIQLRGKQGSLRLPYHYQPFLQGILYRSISDPAFSTFLHEHGFKRGKRGYKLFCFSRLIGPMSLQRDTKQMIFKGSITWKVSTVLPEVAQFLSDYLLLQPYLHIAGQPVEVENLLIEKSEITDPSYTIQMISPITVHSTYETLDGAKKTHFFAPKDGFFEEYVQQNFRRKYEAFYEEEPNERFIIEPLAPGHPVITQFKGLIIKGWMGRYRIQSSPKQIQFSYLAGIGGRNSQGFGMFDLLDT